MALRIRRGLSSDRTSITPEEGEFLYTTDTYQVYIGDGTTPGGNPLYTLGSLGGIGLTDLSATTPLSYDNTTGVFSIQVASASQSGFLSNTNWVTFNNKQNALTLTNVGTSGAATLIGSTLNIPIYGAGGSGSGSVTDVSVVTANGFAGTVATSTTTPAITLSTTITGLLKGNGTSISAATAGTDYQSALTGTGLVLSTGGTISYVTNNSTNWNTAYTNRITSLTTTGSSGAATLVSNTLNIPTYTAAGLGAVVTTRTISTTTPLQGGGDLSADRTLSILQATTSQSGYLSSTDWNTFNGKQAALSGTGIVKSTAGTISYLTDNSSNWNTAFGWGNHASAGYLLSTTAATTYTPLTRTLTINGTAYDLSANRSWTITTGATNLDGLSDVVINGSLAYGDILQYTTSNQWENVPLSALTSVGAGNGLSFSGGNVILGGTLDLSTTINTYKAATSSQYSLSFTSGSTSFSSPGTAPIVITDTSANVTGKAALYVGANTNHGILVEGKGAPTTTAPTYGYKRATADLIKNAGLYSKNAQGVSYLYSNSDETHTSLSRYATPSIPAALIEKTTGLVTYAKYNAASSDPDGFESRFKKNMLYNLLSLRLTKHSTLGSSLLPTGAGVEISFEAQTEANLTYQNLATIRAYSSSTSSSTLEFTVLDNGEERLGILLERDGRLKLPQYAGSKNVLYATVTSGAITNIVVATVPPTIHYSQAAYVGLTIVDYTTGATSAVATPIFGYKIARIRLTNPGSGYVTAPAVTISAPTSGGSLWTTGTQAYATAVLTSTGEVDYIDITNSGTRYIPGSTTVTIAAPPSGVTATATVEFGLGEFLYANITTAGSGYTSANTSVYLTNVGYDGSVGTTQFLMGVDINGYLTKNLLGLDFIINGRTGGLPFGDGGTLFHNTTLDLPSNTFGVNATSLTFAATTGQFNATSLQDFSIIANNPSTSESVTISSALDGVSTTSSNNSIVTTGGTSNISTSSFWGGLQSGGSFTYTGTNYAGTRAVEIYAGSTSAASGSFFGGARIAGGLTYNNDYAYFDYAPKSITQGVSGTTWGTAGDLFVFLDSASTLQTTNNTSTYEVELGAKHVLTVSGYYEDNSGVDTGSFVSTIQANATTDGAVFRGVEFKASSDFPALAGTSKLQIDSTRIYILPNNIGSANDVLKVANATTGELGYTTLSPIATSGNYSDLVTKPALDDITDVAASSPTNGQVLTWNGSSWTPQTPTGGGGGTAGVGLDSVFMLMGA